MKFILITLLIASFVGVTVFGFVAMNHADGHGFSDCIASTAKGALCPSNNPMASAIFHLDAFKNFSTAILETYSFIALFIVLSALLSILYQILLEYFSKAYLIAPRKDPREFLYFSSSRKRLARWLAIREARDYFAPSWGA